MTREERESIAPGSLVEYKRNGFVGARTGRLEFHLPGKNGRRWCAIRDDYTGKLSRGRLSRVLRVINAASTRETQHPLAGGGWVGAP